MRRNLFGRCNSNTFLLPTDLRLLLQKVRPPDRQLRGHVRHVQAGRRRQLLQPVGICARNANRVPDDPEDNANDDQGFDGFQLVPGLLVADYGKRRDLTLIRDQSNSNSIPALLQLPEPPGLEVCGDQEELPAQELLRPVGQQHPGQVG